MVIGGALGNVVDRLFRGDGWFHGSVIDFIDLQWWPIFNVADMAITIGGVLLVLGTVFAGPSGTVVERARRDGRRVLAVRSSAMIAEEIPSALAGQRLDRVVSLVAEVSRAEAARLIDGGFVRLDGATAAAGKERLREGQRLEVDTSGISVPALPGPDPGVDVSVGPRRRASARGGQAAGLVVHPATGNETGTLVNGLLARYPELAQVGQPERPGIVHRLDGGTSGLLLVARTQRGVRGARRTAARARGGTRLRRVVWGEPESPSGLIDAPIGRDPRDPLKMAVVGSGRASRTRYTVERRFESPPVSLLTCRLETGRTHQIRVHLAAIGHPVVADHQYAGRRPTFGLERPFLHARRLELVHPVHRRGDGVRRPDARGPDARALGELS